MITKKFVKNNSRDIIILLGDLKVKTGQSNAGNKNIMCKISSHEQVRRMTY